MRSQTDQRGFALLIVLWTVGLLALIVTQTAGAARSTALVAANIRDSAAAEAAADAGVFEAMFRVLQERWVPDGATPRRIRVGRAVVEIGLEDEATRLNPNYSTPPLLTSLLATVGVDPKQARMLAVAIMDWRTPSPNSLNGGPKTAPYQAAGLPYGPSSKPFDSIEEMGLVVGMTPDILARISPYLSVFQYGDAQPANGAATVAAILSGAKAIDTNAQSLGLTDPAHTVRIRATARVAAGASAARTTIARLNPQAQETGAIPVTVLSWSPGVLSAP